MLKIGLTGGIGSGKTTVANLFKQLGIAILDADKIAEDITKPNTEYFKTIVLHFGQQCVGKDGTLHRALLREIVFADKTKREWLEKLLHPTIIEEITEKMLHLDEPCCIVVVPLLVEFKLNTLFDRILVVNTNEETQLERTRIRDNTTLSIIKQIMQTQSNAADRLRIADDIIDNNGSLLDLEQQVKKLAHFYQKLSKNSV